MVGDDNDKEEEKGIEQVSWIECHTLLVVVDSLVSSSLLFFPVYPESDDDDPSMNQLTMNTPDRPRYYLSPSTLGFEGWTFLGFMGMGYNTNENGGGDNNSECDSENSFGGWSSI